jgi:Rad3-related DNA helicase
MRRSTQRRGQARPEINFANLPTIETNKVAQPPAGHSIVVSDINVKFPHPSMYEAQALLSEKLILAMERSKTSRSCGFLESPTGTGKTLALLTASLAWQQRVIGDGGLLPLASNSKPVDLPSGPVPPAPVLAPPIASLPSPSQPSRESLISEAMLDLDDSVLEEMSQSFSQPAPRFPSLIPTPHPPLQVGSPPFPNLTRPKRSHVCVDDEEAPLSKRQSPDESGTLATQPYPHGNGAPMHSPFSRLPQNASQVAPQTSNSTQTASNSSDSSEKRVPTIFYATRTHTQVKKAVSELYKTPYRPKMSVLGARDNYCLNHEVKSLPKGQRDIACRKSVKKKACHYHLGRESIIYHPELKGPTGRLQVWDVEDLVELGSAVVGCGYYASREIAKAAELVFCPYNYLVDLVIAEAFDEVLKDSICIIDEAHNIEDMCRTEASHELTAHAIKLQLKAIERAETLSARYRDQFNYNRALHMPTAPNQASAAAPNQAGPSASNHHVPSSQSINNSQNPSKNGQNVPLANPSPKVLAMFGLPAGHPPPPAELASEGDDLFPPNPPQMIPNGVYWQQLVDEARGVKMPARWPEAIRLTQTIKKHLLNLLHWLSKVAPTQLQPVDKHPDAKWTKTWKERDVVNVMRLIKLTPFNYQELRSSLAKISAIQGEWEEDESINTNVWNIFDPFALGDLGRLFRIYNFMLSHDGQYFDDYRWIVSKELEEIDLSALDETYFDHFDDPNEIPNGFQSRTNSNRSHVERKPIGFPTKSWTYKLKINCLNSAILFRELLQKARCVVLVSGTLAPFSSMRAELGVEPVVPRENVIQVSTPHIIARGSPQLTSLRMAHYPSPDAMPIRMDYHNANKPEQIENLGNLIIKLLAVIPDGTLLFFGSYGAMNNCIFAWKKSGIFKRMNDMKTVSVEPQDSKKEFTRTWQSYLANVDTGDGALFMGVSRGKIAEGIDFQDQYARAVIVVGIPFPQLKDESIVQKREWNAARLLSFAAENRIRTTNNQIPKFPQKAASFVQNSRSSANSSVAIGGTGSSVPSLLQVPRAPSAPVSAATPDYLKRIAWTNLQDWLESDARGESVHLSSDLWYELQAFRAINQAVGRCIRHARDYGAIILLDGRFCKKDNEAHLSKWVRESLLEPMSCDHTINALKHFYATNQANLGMGPVPEARQAQPTRSTQNLDSRALASSVAQGHVVSPFASSSTNSQNRAVAAAPPPLPPRTGGNIKPEPVDAFSRLMPQRLAQVKPENIAPSPLLPNAARDAPLSILKMDYSLPPGFEEPAGNIESEAPSLRLETQSFATSSQSSSIGLPIRKPKMEVDTEIILISDDDSIASGRLERMDSSDSSQTLISMQRASSSISLNYPFPRPPRNASDLPVPPGEFIVIGSPISSQMIEYPEEFH